MIKVGVDVYFSNDCGEILLLLVLDMGYFDIVRVLIKVGVDDNVCNEMIICLYKFCEKRDLENVGYWMKEWEICDLFSKLIGVCCVKYKINGWLYYWELVLLGYYIIIV